MIGRVLGVYLAKEFLRNVIFIFVLFFSLIIVVDLIELSRDLGKTANASLKQIFFIAIFRAPAFAENVLPFSILFGASMCLLSLNRRLELVIARASGVSVWQFLWPLVLTAAIIGSLASFAYNPLSLAGTVASRAFEASAFGRVKGGFSNKTKNFWLRLNAPSGDLVLRARVSQNKGVKLTAVSAYRFSTEGDFNERIDAAEAQYVTQGGKNYYILTDTIVTTAGQRGQKKPKVKLEVLVSKSQLQLGQTTAEDVSIWSLGSQTAMAEQSGKNALPFKTRFYALLAQPLLFIAMVLLAGTVSLTFARFGLNTKVFMGGVLAGFVLYVLTKLVVTFGSNGLVPPLIAAWSPAIVASLICTTILLHQEDS
ncbi:MAG: LptF/LptG family permease [Rhizobiaceae bacterium]